MGPLPHHPSSSPTRLSGPQLLLSVSDHNKCKNTFHNSSKFYTESGPQLPLTGQWTVSSVQAQVSKERKKTIEGREGELYNPLPSPLPPPLNWT